MLVILKELNLLSAVVKHLENNVNTYPKAQGKARGMHFNSERFDFILLKRVNTFLQIWTQKTWSWAEKRNI